jgi:hypothetical protein
MDSSLADALRAADPLHLDRTVAVPDEVLLARILDAPAAAGPVRRRGRRVAAVAVTAVAAPLLGLGAAAATGTAPGAVRSVFPWLADGAALVRVEKVAVLAGPPGRRLEFWRTVDADGRECLNHAWVDADAPPTTFDGLDPAGAGAGAGCSADRLLDARLRFSGLELARDGVVVFEGEPGAAVRAEVRLSTGEVLPATVADGWVVGWYRWQPGVTATLVGRDAAGREVGRTGAVTPGVLDGPP